LKRATKFDSRAHVDPEREYRIAVLAPASFAIEKTSSELGLFISAISSSASHETRAIQGTFDETVALMPVKRTRAP
jgi:hypothetical protein